MPCTSASIRLSSGALPRTSGRIGESPLKECAQLMDVVAKALVSQIPSHDRLGVPRQCLEFTDGCLLQTLRRADDNTHDKSLSRPVPLECAPCFYVPAVNGSTECWTDQEQDYIGFVKVAVDLSLPFPAGSDNPIVPDINAARAHEKTQVFHKLATERLVLVSIGNEDAERPLLTP